MLIENADLYDGSSLQCHSNTYVLKYKKPQLAWMTFSRKRGESITHNMSMIERGRGL